MGVVLLFIDGVGVGVRDPGHNPLARVDHLLSRFLDAPDAPVPLGGRAFLLDATFGVPGRPQSASNQTALLTGLPAPALCGGHVLGFPNAALRRLLAAESEVKQLVAAGRRATFANSYPTSYLQALRLPHRPGSADGLTLPAGVARRLRPSATTCAFAAGEVPLRTLDDARAGRGLTHDIDGARARLRGLEVPNRTPEEAADILWHVAQDADFTLFEHYVADEAGHAQDAGAALGALSTFDAFARAVVARRPLGMEVLVCSDHGNVEDLSTRNHTRNPVPLLWFGEGAPADADGLGDVAALGRIVLRRLGVTPGAGPGAGPDESGP